MIDNDLAEKPQAQQRLADVNSLGERLMREHLSLLVDSNHFQDNATPHFLVNPLSVEHFSEETSAQQQARDLIKEALCRRGGVTLVVVHPQDLRAKIPDLLPRRGLRGHTALIDYLESEGCRYRQIARRQGWRMQ